ncbi:MAG: hypothetical protein EB015_19620, partial [Methylocystaceae bacterium]|nr:hypothetical protein [Methylocystaceae bacterium]
KPEELGEDALFSAYLEHLSSDMPGLRATIAAIGRYMYEHRTPVLPVEVANHWIMEWRKGIHSSAAAAKLDPIEELVSASLLMRPTEEGLGVDRKLVAFQFSHQKMCEQILWAELRRQIAPRQLPESGTFFEWAKYASGIENDDTPFPELTSALERLAAEFVIAGDGEPISMLLDLEHEQTRERLMGTGLRALGPIWGPTKDGMPQAAGVIKAIAQYAASKHPWIENYHSILSELVGEGTDLLDLPLSEVELPKTAASRMTIRQRYKASKPVSIHELCSVLSNSADWFGKRGYSLAAIYIYGVIKSVIRPFLIAGVRKGELIYHLADSLNKLGDLQANEGNHSVAEDYYKFSAECSEQYNKLKGPKIYRIDIKALLAASHYRLGDLTESTGQSDYANYYYKLSIATFRKLVSVSPERTDIKLELAGALDRLGDCVWNLGDSAAARLLYEEALEISRAVVITEPHSADFQQEVVYTLNRLGDLAKSRLDSVNARLSYEEAV